MPGTSIDNIDYSKNDVAKIIDEALNEKDTEPIQQVPQPPPQYPMYPQPQPPQYQQIPSGVTQEDGFTIKIPTSTNFIKIIILFILLILLNNNSFKNILKKIPFVVNQEGTPTFLLTLVIALLISLVYFIIISVF